MRDGRIEPSLALPLGAAAFAVRAVAGLAFSYGALPSAFIAVALSLAYGALSAILPKAAETPPPRPPRIPVSFSSLLHVSPFVLYTGLALADSVTVGPAAISPWPLLVIIPAALDTGSGTLSLFAAALPAACGFADAAGAFSGAARLADLVPLALSMIAAALARVAARERQASVFRSASDYVERERVSASKRDAEVEIAARIQRSLLLDTPDAAARGLGLEAITIASASVDGDFYAFIPYSPESMDVLIGDVMGKGVPAALLGAALKGAFLRSSLRLLASRPDAVPSPEALVSAVHEGVVRELMHLESFATLHYARIDSKRGRMDYVDCGHTPILHYDAALGVCWAVKGTDLPLGFTEENAYARYTLPIGSGDRLIFHSDGITEANDANGDPFGVERLADIVSANSALDPRELVRRILNTAMYFASSEGFRDDVTCVAVSVDRVPAATLSAAEDFPASLASLGDIRTFLESSLSGEGEDVSARVVIVAGELVSNAIRHGAAAREASATEASASPLEELGSISSGDGASVPLTPPGPAAIRLECRRTEEWIAVRLLYRGDAFPWHRPGSTPLIESMPSGGMGRLVIDEAADSVLYASLVGTAGGLADLRLVCAFFERGKRAERSGGRANGL